MANTIAHLAVAKELINHKNDLIENEKAFYLGVLAPDTIAGKKDATKEDKKRVHLREDIRDAQWLEVDNMELFTNRIKEFVHSYILNEKDAEQRDFNIGYLVHLLTDKCNHMTMRQKLLLKAYERDLTSSDREFYLMCVNDLEALDAYLLEKYPELGGVFEEIRAEGALWCLPGMIEKEYIDGAIWWWSNCYLPGIAKRELLYVKPEDIEDFIPFSVHWILDELEQLIQ